MSYSDVRQQLDRILDDGEVLDLELIAKRPLQKHDSLDGWVKTTPVSECVTVVLLGHVRIKGRA